MRDDLSITIATEADVPLILRFIQDLAEYERLRHECVATEEALRNTLFGARPAAEVFIARLGGEPVGFALFYPDYSTFNAAPGIYLEDLFVNPSARGKGIGRALLAAIAQLAVERNCSSVEWTVLDWNEPAIGFYKRLGAKPMDEWTNFRVSGDAMRMLAAEPS
jgi:GNAT superfamily N-acetyltransferase